MTDAKKKRTNTQRIGYLEDRLDNAIKDRLDHLQERIETHIETGPRVHRVIQEDIQALTCLSLGHDWGWGNPPNANVGTRTLLDIKCRRCGTTETREFYMPWYWFFGIPCRRALKRLKGILVK